MIDKFNNLPVRLKIVIVAFGSLVLLAILASIPQIVQTHFNNQILTPTNVFDDKHSGNKLYNDSTIGSINYSEPNKTPVVVGHDNLLKYGLSYNKMMLAKSILMAYYQHQNVADNTSVKLISVGKDIKNGWNGTTSTGIYNTTIQLDGKGDPIPLQIIDTYSSLKYYFAVRLKFDQDYQTIYETSNNIN